MATPVSRIVVTPAARNAGPIAVVVCTARPAGVRHQARSHGPDPPHTIVSNRRRAAQNTALRRRARFLGCSGRRSHITKCQPCRCKTGI
jgi:hypothetical protein